MHYRSIKKFLFSSSSWLRIDMPGFVAGSLLPWSTTTGKEAGIRKSVDPEVILSAPDLVRAFQFFSSLGCLCDHHAQVMVLGCLGKAIKRSTRFHVMSHSLKTGCNRDFIVGQARGYKWILIAPDSTRTIALVIIAL